MCPCQVCTEARDATKNAKKKSPKAKTRPGKKGTKARKGCVSGSANVPVCRYIYIERERDRERDQFILRTKRNQRITPTNGCTRI